MVATKSAAEGGVKMVCLLYAPSSNQDVSCGASRPERRDAVQYRVRETDENAFSDLMKGIKQGKAFRKLTDEIQVFFDKFPQGVRREM